MHKRVVITGAGVIGPIGKTASENWDSSFATLINQGVNKEIRSHIQYPASSIQYLLRVLSDK